MSQNFPDDPKLSESRPESQQPAPSAPSTYGSSPPAAFYSPPPSSPPEAKTSSGSRLRMLGLGVLAAVALGAGTWYGVAAHHPSPGPTIAATAKTQKTFSVSKVDLDLKATEQLKKFLAGGGGGGGDGTSSESSAAAALHAVNGPALMALAKTNPQLADEIKSGRRVLYRVYLLDFLEEDGDHAELFVDGVGLGDLYLKNAGTEILIPLAPGVPAQMKLLATVDGGGGGVTVGFVSSLGETRTRIMQVGEFEQWQVTVQ